MLNSELTITKEEINFLPLTRFPGKIRLVTTPEETARAAEEINGISLLGFDTESRPSFTRGESHPIALIQLATEKTAWLFRVNILNMPRELERLLEDSSIRKVVQAAVQEKNQIMHDFGTGASGFIDLLPMAKEAGCHPLSIRALAAIFLNERISKSARITNWERRVLSQKQIGYAATDAWVGLRIYLRMKELGLAD